MHTRPLHFRPKLFKLISSFFLVTLALRGEGSDDFIAARVNHAPNINGEVRGDIWQNLPEGRWLNSGAVIEGQWRVPGAPQVQLNGAPAFGGLIEGTGTAHPTNYQIGLNQGSVLHSLLTRTDPQPLPTVDPPQSPSGHRSINLNDPNQSHGTFRDLRNLTLNSDAGVRVIPPGVYGDFTANNGSGFRFGVAGDSEPVEYHFQRLTINSGAVLEVAGPVVIHLRYGTNLNGPAGEPGQCDRLRLYVSNGGVTLNSGVHFHGRAVAPAGTIYINNNSEWHGSLVANRLTVNSGGLLQYCGAGEGGESGGGGQPEEPAPTNAPPIVDAGEDRTHHIDGVYTIFLDGSVTDDGLPTGVALGIRWSLVEGPGSLVLDEATSSTTTATFSSPGTYTLRLTADDSEFAVSDTVTHTVVQVNRPPYFTSTPVLEVSEGVVYTYAVAADDPDLSLGDTLAVIAPVLPAWLSLVDNGDGTGTLSGNPNRAEVGSHAVTLRVSDAAGLWAEQSFTVEVLRVNLPPVVDAGEDQVVPQGLTAMLIGAVSDDGLPTGHGLELEWALIEGPGDVVFADSAALETEVVFEVAGDYRFRLVAFDGELSAHDEVLITLLRMNEAPVVDAGPDFELNFLGTVNLQGSVSDDGLPEDGNLESWWRVIEGADSAVTFENDRSPVTLVSFSQAGIYRLQLLASDGGATGVDEMWVSITLPNTPPVVDAGVDFTVVTGRRVALQGVVEDDGLPLDGRLVSAWTLVEGNSVAFGIADAGAPRSEVVFTEPGIYRLRLSASDGELGAADEVSVTVLKEPNLPPRVDAGGDQSVQLGNALRLFGEVEDDGLPEDGELVVGWTQVSGPAEASIDEPAALSPLVVFAEAGEYRFRLDAWDGELGAADEVSVTVGLLNQAPQVDAGPDQVVENGLIALLDGRVIDDGLPLGGELTSQWSQLSGPGEVDFTNPGNPRSGVRVPQPGEYSFQLTAGDGELEASDTVAIRFGTAVNQPPVVDAGEDQVVDFVLSRTDNLLINGDATLAVVDGNLPGWEATAASWVRQAGGGSYPGAVAGGHFFRPANSGYAELRQLVDISLFAESIDEGSQLFEFGVYYQVAEQVRYDLPGVLIEFRDGAGDRLTSSRLAPVPLAGAWGFLAEAIVAPVGAREVVVRLIAQNIGVNAANSVYFDAVSLRGVELAPVFLHGLVTDDGLPEDGELTSNWRTVSGPVAAVFEAADAAATRAYFSAPGRYELALRASDGELTAEDSLFIDVVDADGAPVFTVDAGTDVETALPLAEAFPVGTVAGAEGLDVTVSWTAVGGDDRIFIEDPNSLSPSIRFFEVGEYTLRLSATDGIRTAFDELRVVVTCPIEDTPLDVVMVIDVSGSMGGERIVNARLAATQFIERMIPEDRVAVVPFASSASVTQPLTFDHGAAIDRVRALNASGGTAIHAGINVAAQELLARGRPEAQWVILLLSDGGSHYASAITASQNAQSSGVRIISVGLGSGTNELLMLNTASSRADYFFANTGADLEPIYAALSNSFCRFSNAISLEVFTGPTRRLPNVDTPAALDGRIAPSFLPYGAEVTAEWSLVSGPGTVVFSDAGEAVTEAWFSEPGVYLLELTGRILAGSTSFVERSRQLTVLVDQPTDNFAPGGMAALWRGEGDVRDSVSNFHGLEPAKVDYGAGAIYQGFQFGANAAAVEVPTGGQLNVGRSPDGFTLESWIRITRTSGTETLFGWFDLGGSTQFRVDKVGSSSRYFQLQLRDATGTLRSYNLPSSFYNLGEWVHLALVYYPSEGRIAVYRNGVLQTFISGFGAEGFGTDGDFFFGGNPAGNVLLGGLDEVAVYNRALTAAEVAGLTDPRGKLLLGGNQPPQVDAGADVYLHSVDDVARMRGYAEDDGLPLGSVLRTMWRKLSGPGEVTFQDPTDLATEVGFELPGIYILELSADDGVALASDRIRAVVDGATGAMRPPQGLRAHWPGEGSGEEVVSGLDAHAIGFLGYVDAVVGSGFAHAGQGMLVAPLDGALNVGTSPDGFTVEFWARIDSTSGEQVMAGWFEGDSPRFTIRKRSSSSRLFDVVWTNENGTTSLASTLTGSYSTGVWQHFAFTYSPCTGHFRFFRNGLLQQTLSLPVGGLITEGDFVIGGRVHPTAQILQGAMDEVSVYDRALRAEEVGALHRAGDRGKVVVNANLPPEVNAGADLYLRAADESINLIGEVHDDGLPLDTELRVRWSLLFGPGTVTLGAEDQAATTATFSNEGVYVLRLEASDGQFTAGDTLRVTVGDTSAAVYPASGLRAHWPAEGSGEEVVSGLHAYPLGAVGYVDAVVGSGFAHAGQGMLVAPLDGALNVGTSPEGFTVEFWARIDSMSAEQVLAGWFDGDSPRFIIRKRSISNRLFDVVWRNENGTTSLVSTLTGSYSTGVWQHFAFTYAPDTGHLRFFRNGRHQQTLLLPAGGLITDGDFYIGGRVHPTAQILQGAMDEVSVYDRALDPVSIAAIFNAREQGKVIAADNLPPVVSAGENLVLASVDDIAVLEGFASDDGLPVGSSLTTEWKVLSGPGEVVFNDPASLATTAQVTAPGIYTLELAANDGAVTVRDHLRLEVGLSSVAPSGLAALWPGDGNGAEVINGFDAYAVGTPAFVPAVINQGFQMGGAGFYWAETEGGLDVGASTEGFTLEFWARIDSLFGEQVMAGWFEGDSRRFSISKQGTTARSFTVHWRNSDGSIGSAITVSGSYSTGVWQHFAFAYTPENGNLRFFRNGQLQQTLSLPAGGLNTQGDFVIGGHLEFSSVLQGALDEVAVYFRSLTDLEISTIHDPNDVGRAIQPSNRAPFVFAGHDLTLVDTLEVALDGYVSDDGLPAGHSLEVNWSQIDGPASVAFADPSDVATTVLVPEPGVYRLRLEAFDGALTESAELTLNLLSSVPANIPPVVDAGSDQQVRLPSDVFLQGSAFDPDGGPEPLSFRWSRIVGPGAVVFGDFTALQTLASFSTPGTYVLRLEARDGAAIVFDFVEITVLPEILNAAPEVDAGPDITVAQWAIVTLDATATDDGKPESLQLAWTQLFGPDTALFEQPGQADTRVQFPTIGSYVLQIRAFDGEKAATDTITVSVVDPENNPPVIDAGGPLSGVINTPISLAPVISDDGLPGGSLSFGWTYLDGPGGISFGRDEEGRTTVSFAKVGNHRLRLTVSDGEYTVTDALDITVTAPGRDGPSVVMAAPDAGTIFDLGVSVSLRAEGGDPQGSIVSLRFYADGAPISPPLTPSAQPFEWNGVPAGSFELTARVHNEIGQMAVSAPVNITVLAPPRALVLAAPTDAAYHPVEVPVSLHAVATGGLDLTSVTFTAGGETIGVRTQAPFALSHAFDTTGSIDLSAIGTTSDGDTYQSSVVQIHLFEGEGTDPVARIDAPEQGAEITAPVAITGTAASALLDYYEVRLRPANGPGPRPWQTLDRRTAPVEEGTLATLDPTLLRNGIYEIQLLVRDQIGRLAVTPVRHITLAGGMKVGHFQLAFEDLSIPLSGIPIQLIRSYDSRGHSAGDFGPDWELGYRSARVSTSGAVGGGWKDTVRTGVLGIPFYGLEPISRHVVSVVVGDEVQQFEAYSPTEQGFFELQAASLAFRPINGSVGRLSLASGDLGNMILERIGGTVNFIDFATIDTFDPANWVYTTEDGTRLDISAVNGLRKITDRQGNAVTFTASGITHSSGESIGFSRDAQGRITTITDNEGASFHYAYDPDHGYLAAVTDRAGGTTAFEYVPHPAAPGRQLLDTIIDPLGNRALAASYDDDGRLIAQFDADGNRIDFEHDIPNRRQTITDRLGHATIHEYDLRGNVARTIDPLGHVTLREYDERDNETRLTDALGNITERAYDSKNNLLGETEFAYDADGTLVAHTTSYSYNADSNPTSITDALGQTTAFAYDSTGNLTTMTDAEGASTTFAYDARGNLTAMVDSLGNETTHTYDARGNLTTTTVRGPGGNPLQVTSYTYDGRGNQLTRSLVRTRYDDSGQPIGTETLLTTHQYDAESRLIATTYPDGTTTATVYNAAGQEIRTIDPLGLATEYTYDARGNRTRIDHPDGTVTLMSYDAEDRLLTEI
ncbi:MAG: LamG-like jellyroll fold domain-containing protein, partial [Puniceicoccaceae bacterium]